MNTENLLKQLLKYLGPHSTLTTLSKKWHEAQCLGDGFVINFLYDFDMKVMQMESDDVEKILLKSFDIKLTTYQKKALLCNPLFFLQKLINSNIDFNNINAFKHSFQSVWNNEDIKMCNMMGYKKPISKKLFHLFSKYE